jgi:hypothetical protein
LAKLSKEATSATVESGVQESCPQWIMPSRILKYRNLGCRYEYPQFNVLAKLDQDTNP